MSIFKRIAQEWETLDKKLIIKLSQKAGTEYIDFNHLFPKITDLDPAAVSELYKSHQKKHAVLPICAYGKKETFEIEFAFTPLVLDYLLQHEILCTSSICLKLLCLDSQQDFKFIDFNLWVHPKQFGQILNHVMYKEHWITAEISKDMWSAFCNQVDSACKAHLKQLEWSYFKESISCEWTVNRAHNKTILYVNQRALHFVRCKLGWDSSNGVGFLAQRPSLGSEHNSNPLFPNKRFSLAAFWENSEREIDSTWPKWDKNILPVDKVIGALRELATAVRESNEESIKLIEL